MQIKRKTKIQQGDKVLQTTIPLTIVEVLELQKGDMLRWSIQEGKAIFTKETQKNE